MFFFFDVCALCVVLWWIQVGAGGLDACVPTGTVIGLFDDGDGEGCLLDYSIDDAALQVRLARFASLMRHLWAG